jgi:hypothetical protein
LDEGNLIAGNSLNGIAVGDNATGTVIQGNRIGTDLTGTLDLGNFENGIYLFGISNALVGGTTAGEGNIVAFNGKGGAFTSGISVAIECDRGKHSW